MLDSHVITIKTFSCQGKNYQAYKETWKYRQFTEIKKISTKFPKEALAADLLNTDFKPTVVNMLKELKKTMDKALKEIRKTMYKQNNSIKR